MSLENDTNAAVLHKLQSIATSTQLTAENQAENSRRTSRAILWLAGIIAVATILQTWFAYQQYDLARDAHKRTGYITLPVSASGSAPAR